MTTKHFFLTGIMLLFQLTTTVFAQEPGTAMPAPDPKAGTIGLKIDNMRESYIQQYKLSPKQTGLIVVEAVPGSSSLKAGFKAGDVVTMLNGKKVATTREFMELRLRFKVGDILEISGVSAGKPYTRKVKIMPV